MKKRKGHSRSHIDNLRDLREQNPRAYERLGEGPRQTVETYEAVQLAADYEHRPGKERLLELRDRLPRVYARFSPETKRKVEEYMARKRAHGIVAALPGVE
jgi:hypothetical protein